MMKSLILLLLLPASISASSSSLTKVREQHTKRQFQHFQLCITILARPSQCFGVLCSCDNTRIHCSLILGKRFANFINVTGATFLFNILLLVYRSGMAMARRALLPHRIVPSELTIHLIHFNFDATLVEQSSTLKDLPALFKHFLFGYFLL